MKYPDTQFIRALGILLITNSHLYGYYPIPELATGGAIGNSIFFCLSGFGIYLSQQKKDRPFSEWLTGRVSRIYPSIWLVLIFIRLPILIFSGDMNADYILTFIGHFLNPTHWFIRVLIIYYILAFAFLKPDHKRKILSVLVAMGCIYFLIYFSWMDLSSWLVEDHSIKIIHYFMIFLFGIYLASINEKIKYTGIHNYLVVLLILIISYGHKYLMARGMLFEFQFIQQVAMYPMLYYLLKICRAPWLLSILKKPNGISYIAQFLSEHTLEIYIIQETILRPVQKANLLFPLNMIAFIILAIIFSIMVNKGATMMRARIS